jgi:hypothetical protein
VGGSLVYTQRGGGLSWAICGGAQASSQRMNRTHFTQIDSFFRYFCLSFWLYLFLLWGSHTPTPPELVKFVSVGNKPRIPQIQPILNLK